MGNKIKCEAIELIILFFIIAYGLIWCAVYNIEATHTQAKYESRFNLNPQEGNGYALEMYASTKDRSKN